MTRRVLLAGVSVRAMAESAAAAGYAVLAVDAFGDLDTARVAERVLTPRDDMGVPYSAERAARLSRELEVDAVSYAASFENSPKALELLSRGRRLLGNDPGVVSLARDPVGLSRIVKTGGFPGPAVRSSAPPVKHPARRWLIKPRASGGGRGIQPWRSGQIVPRTCYLQQRILGIPGSLVFVADGTRILALGISRQLIGSRAFGAHGFGYVGNILAPLSDPHLPRGHELLSGATALAEAVTVECGLRGVNGIDFVASDGVPFLVELNPRYSASLELVERAFGLSIFQMHIQGCLNQLPSRCALPPRFRAIGKAVVYARRRVRVGDTRAWLDDPTVADIPRPGEYIAAGQPICTVFARGRTSGECETALALRAARIYSEINARGRAA